MNLLEEAIIFSTLMHQGKVRKFKKIPYILHPLEVALILSTMTDDQEVIAAGVLHDVVENTDGTLKEIGERFGTRVARLVNSASESFSPDEDLAASWPLCAADQSGYRDQDDLACGPALQYEVSGRYLQ